MFFYRLVTGSFFCESWKSVAKKIFNCLLNRYWCITIISVITGTCISTIILFLECFGVVFCSHDIKCPLWSEINRNYGLEVNCFVNLISRNVKIYYLMQVLVENVYCKKKYLLNCTKFMYEFIIIRNILIKMCYCNNSSCFILFKVQLSKLFLY